MEDFNEQFRKQFQQQLSKDDEPTPDTEPKKETEKPKPTPQEVKKEVIVPKAPDPILKKVENKEARQRIRKNFFSGLYSKTNGKSGKKGHSLLVKALIGLTNIFIIIGVVVLVRTFLVSPFSVVGSSMNSNLKDGDLILVDKINYRLSSPSRGDVIVFHPPIEKYSEMQNAFLCKLKKIGYTVLFKDSADACKTRDYFVKRIVGIPGDTVKIQNKKVYVAPPGEQLVEIREDFLDSKNKNNTCFAPSCNSIKDTNGIFLEVQENTLFVLGDNRTGSSDSRAWKIDGKETPFVHFDDVSGKVRAVFFPFSHISLVSSIDILSSTE